MRQGQNPKHRRGVILNRAGDHLAHPSAAAGSFDSSSLQMEHRITAIAEETMYDTLNDFQRPFLLRRTSANLSLVRFRDGNRVYFCQRMSVYSFQLKSIESNPTHLNPFFLTKILLRRVETTRKERVNWPHLSENERMIHLTGSMKKAFSGSDFRIEPLIEQLNISYQPVAGAPEWSL